MRKFRYTDIQLIFYIFISINNFQDGGMDIFIGGVRDRNTALHGDVVAALINPPDQWKVGNIISKKEQ